MNKKLGIIMTVFALFVSACSESNNKLPTINKHEIKTVETYTYDFSSEEIGFAPVENARVDFHFFNDDCIPYIGIEDYFTNFADLSSTDEEFTSYSFQTFATRVVVTNIKQRETATIDFESQKIIYSNYGAFLSNTAPEGFSTNFNIMGGEEYFVDSSFNLKVGNEYVIDLAKYNMLAYLDGGRGYLPFYLFRNIFQLKSIITFFYNGKNLYTLLGFPDNEAGLSSIENIRNNGDINYLKNPKLIQFNYDLLALTIDNIFGLTKRTSRVDNHEITYFKDGAYKALEPYKERLLSTEPNVSNDAIYEIFDNLINDGGHSGYGCLNIFSTRETNHEHVGERKHTEDTLTRLSSEREKANYSPKQVLNITDPLAETPVGSYQEINGVAYITLDSFINPTSKPKLDSINNTNYYNDTISLISYSNKMIKEHNIKKVIIDLSCNSGGVVYACLYASSWLSKGSLNVKSINVKDKNYSESTLHADINLNGIFDEDDYLDESIKAYCIISNCSFSCANYMPALLEDNSNVKFIGEQSGGGAATVCTGFNTALGGTMSFSTMLVGLRNSSTKDNYIDNEDGVNPTFYKISSDEEHASEFYNRSAIVEKVLADN